TRPCARFRAGCARSQSSNPKTCALPMSSKRRARDRRESMTRRISFPSASAMPSRRSRISLREKRVAEVSVEINGRKYRMACEDGQETHLTSLATRFNKYIDDYKGSFGEIGDNRLTV